MVRRARSLRPLPTAVVYPCEAVALQAAVDAVRLGLAEARFYGPAERIRALATANRIEVPGAVIDCGDAPVAAAERAVTDAASGLVQALMKGSLHSDELLGAVLARDGGLRQSGRITHTFVFDVPRYQKLLGVTDAVVNIAPDLKTKSDALRNGCELLRRIGVTAPKVAVLAAIETVNPSIPATLDAAELVRLGQAGHFGDALVEGPFGLDNAISEQAARAKGLQSTVAGQPDLLLVPDLNAGNIFYKSLIYLAGGECAGIVQGAKVPVILTSRADSAFSRIASCALARLFVPDQITGSIC
ncbi:MAG: bifunctional enoyl-CoA hydratase/phosphate acetyltransferase [Burkholderiales bacterium]|nr:bifunctional enoyl-CoA hydratase/phosphate acetyltransferase [Burkholderiales bacterium]